MKNYSFFGLAILMIITIICGGLSTAMAQANVNIRTGAHDEYSRLVFDWTEAADYKLSNENGLLTVSFDKVANTDADQVNKEDLENIGTVSVVSKPNENLVLTIQVKPNSKIRDFNIGNRVVIDVYNSNGAITKTVSNPAPSSASSKDVEQKEPVKAPPVTLLDDSEFEVEVKPAPLLGPEPHVITMTSTNSVGLAAFIREGFLWMVFDDPTLKTAPILAGPKADQFPKLEKIGIENGVAYRMLAPEGFLFYGQGGGLLWRIVLTPNPRSKEPVKPIAEKADPTQMAGGTLVLPYKAVRKILTFNDPLIGDTITAITTEGSEDYTQIERQYVELEMLPSMVGTALISKTDGITVQKTARGVEITKPQGLILSSPEDTALAELKDDIEKEDEFFEEQEKTEHLNRIYNFDRWEMGGIKSLEKNRQILMRGVAVKEGSAKVEDIITLAKVNIANDRGPEALGLLRVATQEIPGIEENPEFIALEGAAEVLAGKPDLAIETLSNASLEPFTEINIWRAYALAGLEDWQQADAIMPTDFDVIDEYPIGIKKPLILALSEVSLRAGKTNQAEELLSLLEGEYEEMSVSHQSAWKYLNGELEHQIGQFDKAIKLWQELVSGEDDYYRAKAALSLTRLQLDKQNITPAKAIDRLEGLRYAWRGDELETLINLRLGEVYIQNGDYLKGLSILRNAVSFSPDSTISQEVANLMTTTFRDLFTDGSLENVSPLDAVTIYEEFKELTPAGEDGDIFVQNLAERLVDVDLLDRASSLLSDQLKFRLKGEEALKVAIRLAAIQLLDDKAPEALDTLKIADQRLAEVGNKENYGREISLLKARAFSKSNQASKALNILKAMPEDSVVNRLRADIAWNGGQWDQAAVAFGHLIEDENISLTRPPDEYQSNLILNRAIALNLSGDRTTMSQFRDKYNDVMAQTEKAKIFNLVTRPRQIGSLDDQGAISSLISEVDLFGEFLESYKKAQE